MYKARCYKTDGTEAGDRELPIWLFDGIVNDHVLHQAVRAYLLNQRQGSASAKTRSEMRGGGRKPWRQKGTGRARHGSIRSPIWAGGAVVFPPKPKSWRVDLPKKVKRLAKRSALNARAEEGRVVVVDALDFEEPKTKRLRQVLESIEADGKVLVLTDGVKENVYLSGRNMPRVKVMPLGQEAAYDVLWASQIVIEAPALESAAEKAEAEGLVEKAHDRIARHEAKAELEEELAAQEEAGEPEAEASPEPDEAGEEPEAEAAPEVEEEAHEEEVEEEAPVAEAGEAPDVDAIDLPTVKELADFLADFDDPDTIRALQDRDDRKTAQKHYDARIEELTGGEEDDG